MAISEDDLIVLRSWVPWDPPSDTDLEDSYDRLGGIYQVAEEEIRKQLQTVLSGPDSFSIPGDYSESNSARIQALERRMSKASMLAEQERREASGAGAARLTRADEPRR